MQLRPSDATNLAGKTDEELGRRHLSHSSTQMLLACNRKYELKYRKGLELIEASRPLSLGKAFQKAIEHQSPEFGVRALRGQEPCPECGGSGEVEREQGMDCCGTCGGSGWTVGDVDQRTPSQLERLIVDEAIVAGASKLYLSKWPAGPGETREFEYRVRLRSPYTGAYSRTFDLLGYADGLVGAGIVHSKIGDTAIYNDARGVPQVGHGLRVGEHAAYELIENKLVGEISPQKVQRLPLDRQVSLARYGIWRATGRKVETVRYRWVRKPSIRLRKNETIEEFAERIRQDYEARPDFYYHEEEPQFATTGDLLRIEAELWQLAEILRHSERGRIYVRNTAHCSDFGGCPYVPICTGDPDAMSLYRRTT